MKICLVCGYNDLEEMPYDKFGCASFEICPCCGTEFGYDDSVKNPKDLPQKWKKLREEWIEEGAKWFLPKHKPKDWSLEKQLKNLKSLSGKGITKNRKKLLITITGSPGVGKSTLAKFLVTKLGFDRLDLHHHYKRISTGYNRSKQSYDVDYRKFEKLVKEKLKQAKKGLIIDSHISHLLPKRLVDICIVLTCSDLKRLETRLRKRKYSKKKIRENLDAEIFQVCLMEAKEKRHQILVFDTTQKMDEKKILREVNKSL